MLAETPLLPPLLVIPVYTMSSKSSLWTMRYLRVSSEKQKQKKEFGMDVKAPFSRVNIRGYGRRVARKTR